MLTLYANPYDTSAEGFYFKSLEEYEKKADKLRNKYGDPVEEFEIDFIDGNDTEQMVFKAMGVAQHNIDDYFEVVDEFDDDDIVKITILMEDMGYDFDDAVDKKDDLIVYGEFDDDEEFAMEFVDQYGGLSELGDTLQTYFDYDAFGRDIRLETYEEEDLERIEGMSDQEIGEEYADDVGWEGVGKQNLENYFDWSSYARDLMFDMSVMNGVYYDPNSI